ncbi:hypothetical protein NHX12_029722 [Muraenolepis orangiensis]|uniref:Large ribosomal subunit protein P2 n=1 Tax=Muraenolepis orangiensis TaxID=630683 RepID=A0A9Q0IM22_9TELE|nr:hypothetical protein NHX12_029722 [Muraenolepis orangiensis]
MNQEEGVVEVEDVALGSEEAALFHIGRYVESRRALPWEQWSSREKANYCLDRFFLGFLAVFLLVLFAEVCYKTWYVTNLRVIVTWLFGQEEKEELMRYVAAYLLAALGGNTSPAAKDIKAILSSVGIEAEDERLNKVISEMNGKNINEVLNSGLSKLASVPAGGAVVASAAAGGGGGVAKVPAGAAPAAAEEKKEEKKDESEESDDDMGFGLFD